MTVQVQETEYCKVDVHYIAEPKKVQAKRQEAIAMIRKRQIPGFRPGKAPDAVIKVRFKDAIDEWVKDAMLMQARDEILFETKMKFFGQAHANDVGLHNNDFWCNISFLRKPDVELKEYKGLEIPKPHLEMSAGDLTEKIMQEQRVRFSEIQPYGENDFVEMGDQVTLDFTATNSEGAVLATTEGQLHLVGQSVYLGFDDSIMGMKSGDERTFTLNFDDTVAVDSFKNQTIDFKVTVHMGTKKVPHALDDELALKAGFENYAALQQAVAGVASSSLHNKERKMITDQVIKRLLANHDVKIPEWLTKMECESLCRQHSVSWDSLEESDKTKITELADQNVKLALIMDTIRETEPESFFTDEELVKVLAHQCRQAGGDPDKFLVESQKNGSLYGMIIRLRDEATLEWLVDQAKIIE